MPNAYRLREGQTVRLPAIAGTPALFDAGADDLRVLLALSLSDYSASVDALAHDTGLSLTRAAAALERWLEAGVIEAGETTAPKKHLVSDELPRGSAADDARVIDKKKLKGCLDTCSDMLGKLLNPSEINILVDIINDLDVSESYLITLLDFCINRLHARGVKYLEKTAVSLCDRGIRSDAALDEYLKQYEASHSAEGEIRRLFGLGARALTLREGEALGRWFGEYGYSMDVVGAAYDITANTANKVSIAYADKILARWHQNGLKTLPEIEAYLASERENRAPRKQKARPHADTATAPSSFNVDAFLESALERSYGNAKKG